IRELEQAARALLEVVVAGTVTGGELGAIADLSRVSDSVQAAMTALVSRVEDQMLAQRRAGLSTEGFLGVATRMPHAERRGLIRTAAGLGRMPALRAAFEAGALGAG